MAGSTLEQLQDSRKSKVLSYVVSTRQGLSFQIADDAVRVIYDHLSSLGVKQGDKLDLFLHSFGGVGVVPWKLVNLIREYTQDFEVLIPHKAYSAATLVALGANRIVMHPMGELGPIDPKVSNEFNPTTPQGQQVGINVEDVASYVAFVKDFVGIRHEDELVQAMGALTSNVHPLALGNVHRFYSQSRMMARKLLRLHMADSKDEQVIDEIVETLTTGLGFHGHPINRKEAAKLALKVEEPSFEVETLMWKLHCEYEDLLEMNKPFLPREMLNKSGKNVLDNVRVNGACVDSAAGRSLFVSEFRIIRPPLPPGVPVSLQMQAAIEAVTVPLGYGWEPIKPHQP